MNPEKHKVLLMTTLIVGVLMAALDIAILGPALPAIRAAFPGLDERGLASLYSIYILLSLVSTPLMAKLSDVFGRRLIYTIDLILFAVGSLLVALAQDFTTILVGRAIQGFGAGGILPVANAVIGDIFPPEKRGTALGLVGVTFGLAFLLGPILAGVLLSVASWHWLFFINIPIALLLLVPAAFVFPHVHHKQTGRFDVLGMLLLTAALTGLTLALTHLDAAHLLTSFASLAVWPWLVLAAAAGGLLVWAERKAANPLLPAALFKGRQLKLTYFLGMGSGMFQSSLVFIPMLAIAHLAGLTPSQSGYLLLPLVVAITIGNPVVGGLIDKLGARPILLAGLALVGVSTALLSIFAANLAWFIVFSALVGLGLAVLLGPPLRFIVLDEVEAAHRSVAQGVLGIFNSVGTLIGGAFMGAVTASFGGGDLGYTVAFLCTSVLALPLVLAAWLLHNRRKAAV